MPDRITIFQGPHERLARNRDRGASAVGSTLAFAPQPASRTEMMNPRLQYPRSSDSLDDLSSGREIQLIGGAQIGTYQVQIVQLNTPVFALRIKKIEE